MSTLTAAASTSSWCAGGWHEQSLAQQHREEGGEVRCGPRRGDLVSDGDGLAGLPLRMSA
ncbi:MAG TPA: hypothetical protein VG142_16190 [Trebonia sp.]|jgi:hypothetical protein|nr:hypothetical protein [Trebonia sp.]